MAVPGTRRNVAAAATGSPLPTKATGGPSEEEERQHQHELHNPAWHCSEPGKAACKEARVSPLT